MKALAISGWVACGNSKSFENLRIPQRVFPPAPSPMEKKQEVEKLKTALL
jgi:hypothetical protein